METTFESMRCPDEHKVACATYVLQKDAEVWWSDNKQSINSGEGITTWENFKEAFLKYYYPKETRIKKQQEFNHLTQGDRKVDQYDQEFMRLRRFALSLADTEEKQMLGLNPKSHRMLEAFNPKTYEKALRTAKALEEPSEEKKTEPTVVTGRKRPVEVETTDSNHRSRDLDIRVMWPELALQGAREIQGNPLEDRSFESPPYKPAHRPGHMQRPVKRWERLAPWGTCTLSILGHFALTLFDSGSTHSFVSLPFVKQAGFVVEPLIHILSVGTPAGVDLVTKNRVKDGQMVIAGQTIQDLKVVDMTNFDVILGMDWLAENFAGTRNGTHL
ncbi:uncharacterized protein LOC111471874 [Cucurbita maxima]|uniref:Uncharacterized protein LOC111471874 n=1 Tax=Cucurbita maxima TaxID=3661 RepID=A0A6J1ICP5_CUCMA|nr:uncharacterized protein LOC111471874 [Cucurbita maxima]